jgi:hypothetical protein
MADNVWNNSTLDGKASTDVNWSLGHKPTTTDRGVFDGTCTANCNWDYNNAATLPTGWYMDAAYTGTITQNALFAWGTYGWHQFGGTFLGGAYNVGYQSGSGPGGFEVRGTAYFRNSSVQLTINGSVGVDSTATFISNGAVTYFRNNGATADATIDMGGTDANHDFDKILWWTGTAGKKTTIASDLKITEMDFADNPIAVYFGTSNFIATLIHNTSSSSNEAGIHMGSGTWTTATFNMTLLVPETATLHITGATGFIGYTGSYSAPLKSVKFDCPGGVTIDTTLTNTAEVMQASNTIASGNILKCLNSLTVDAGSTLTYVGTGKCQLIDAGIAGLSNSGSILCPLELVHDDASPGGSTYSRTLTPFTSSNLITFTNTSSTNAFTCEVAAGSLSTISAINIAANGSRAMLLDGTSGNPSVTCAGIAATGTGAGAEQLKMGTGAWTDTSAGAHNLDFSGIVVTSDSSDTLILSGTGTPTVTFASGQSLGYLTGRIGTMTFTYTSPISVAHLSSSGSLATPSVFQTSSAGHAIAFTYTGALTSGLWNKCTFKDFDASGGNTIHAYGSTLVSGCTNIDVTDALGKRAGLLTYMRGG